jgi:hypothetical protein
MDEKYRNTWTKTIKERRKEVFSIEPVLKTLIVYKSTWEPILHSYQTLSFGLDVAVPGLVVRIC